VAARSRVPARVEWVRPAEKGSVFGLSFAGLAPEPREGLRAVVAEFRRLADEIAS
jgi:hypothetical protein